MNFKLFLTKCILLLGSSCDNDNGECVSLEYCDIYRNNLQEYGNKIKFCKDYGVVCCPKKVSTPQPIMDSSNISVRSMKFDVIHI